MKASLSIPETMFKFRANYCKAGVFFLFKVTKHNNNAKIQNFPQSRGPRLHLSHKKQRLKGFFSLEIIILKDLHSFYLDPNQTFNFDIPVLQFLNLTK